MYSHQLLINLLCSLCSLCCSLRLRDLPWGGRGSFDYGNAETNAKDDGDATMEAIYFGSSTKWWKRKPANLTGPFIAADFEQGVSGLARSGHSGPDRHGI